MGLIRPFSRASCWCSDNLKSASLTPSHPKAHKTGGGHSTNDTPLTPSLAIFRSTAPGPAEICHSAEYQRIEIEPSISQTVVPPFNLKSVPSMGKTAKRGTIDTNDWGYRFQRPCRRALKRETRVGSDTVAVVVAGLLSDERTAPTRFGFSTTVSRKALAFDDANSSLLLLGTAETTAGGLSRAPGVAAEDGRAGRFSPPPKKPFFHWGPRDGLAAAQFVHVARGVNGEGRFPFERAKAVTSTDSRGRQVWGGMRPPSNMLFNTIQKYPGLSVQLQLGNSVK